MIDNLMVALEDYIKAAVQLQLIESNVVHCKPDRVPAFATTVCQKRDKVQEILYKMQGKIENA